MPINYIPATRGGYGKLVSTDPNPNSREFFREIIRTVNVLMPQLNLNLSCFSGIHLEDQPRTINLGMGVELHMKRVYGTHEFQGVFLTAQHVPQTRMFGHRYSNTQRTYTYNRTSRVFLLCNLLPAINELMRRSEVLFAQRSELERRRQIEYDAQRRENETCQGIAREHSFASGDELVYYRDREKYRIIIYLDKYQIHKVLKAIKTVRSLAPANTGGIEWLQATEES